MPDWIAVIILGIVEGVTEFLPVSSTGHLLLVRHWLPIRSEMLKSDLFIVVIQPAAVVAVILVFWKRLEGLVREWHRPESRDYVYKMAAAFGLTGVGGLAIKKVGFELPETVTPVALALLVGGVMFLAVEWWLKSRPTVTEVTWVMALAMGAGQLLAAVFPGLSRSGATILVALMFGLARPQAAEFSFLLGIPTLLAAGAKETWDALRDPPPYPLDWGLVALGSVVSGVTAFVAVKWLLRYVQSHTFNVFGVYRVVVGLLILAWV
ncbi:MAG: undecaprenyl-diphosphate phosphatase [Verrucomicrobiae bacterium]|nr:undecaprenyl-diphosphate phosphatase [Verrucomicrobiae bacterium]